MTRYFILAVWTALISTAVAHAQQPDVPRNAVYAFGERSHLDVLAVRLQNQANNICWEMHLHYSHNNEFRETYREMYTVLQDSIHIHDLIHRDAYLGHPHGNEDHIARDLHEMDRLFHHVEDDVEHWDANIHGHYQHHVLGLHTRMAHFADTLHHLMRDYGVKSRVGLAPAPPPAPGPNGGSALPPFK